MIKFWIDIKNRSWLQSTALGLLGALLFSIIAPPFAEANLWSERRKALEEMEKKKEPLQLASLAGLPIHQPSLLPSLETGLSPESMQQVMSKVQARAFSSFGKRSAKRNSLGLPSELVSRIEGFGDIERVYLTNNNQPKPLIILIQDAHGIYGAQKNIAQLIKEMTGMGVGLVGVEGSVGKMEGLEKWRRYQDKKILMGIAGYLLEQGLLTGVEVAGLATEPALEVKDKSQNPASSSSLPYIEYYGIEDKDKYLEQVSSFKQTLKSNKEVEEWKGQIAKEISDLKNKFYTEALKELDGTKNRYETSQMNLGDWLEFLNNKASLSSNVSMYLSAYKLEKEINFKKVSEEQKRLLEKLSHKLSKKELMGLLEESLAYRLGKIGYGEFYTGIKERCDKAELKINSELGKYISYVGKVEAIDRDRLFIEAKELEEQVWKNKINNSKSENLYAIDKDYRLLEKAINFKLSPEEWEEYDQRKVEIEKIAERIRGVAINTLTSGNLGRADKQVRELALNTTRGAQDLSLNKTVREVMRNVREFNRLSHERNHIFVEKLIARMIEKSSKEKNHPIDKSIEFDGSTALTIGQLGSNISILVAGGYHSRGMEDLLRKKQISYITIRPSLNTAEISKDYHPLNAFKRDLLPLEKMFSREKVSIAFPQATGGIDPSVITPEESGVEGTLSVVTEGMKKIQEDEEVVATEDDGIRSKEVSNKEFLKDSREPSSHFRSLIVRKKVPYNGKSYTLFTLRKEDEKLSQRLLNDPKTELEDHELLDGAENLWAGQMKDPFTGEVGPTFAVGEESNLLLRARELFLPIAQQVNVMSSAFVKNQVKGFVYRKETLTKKQGLKWKKYLALPAYLASAGSTGQEWMVYIVVGLAAVVFLIDNRKSIFSFFVDLFRNLGIEKAVDEGVRKIKANVTTILAGDWKEKALALKFKDLRKEDTAIAGGKGANLGELENKGAPGRTGFVTTSKAFLEFLEKNNLERDGNTITLLQAIQEIILKVNVGDAIELNKASQEIQNLIRQKDLPLDLVAAIKQQYQELCDYYDVGDDLPVAVRSSGTREDLEEASSAGIQATYLHVQGIEEILMRVKDDYASLYLPRAISYRDQTLVNAFINKLEETKKHSFQAFLNKLRQSKDSYLAAFSERLENPSSRVPSLELRQVLDGALFKDEKELFNKVLPKYTDPAEVSMAVVIQAMMKNNRAFTIFSVDNRTGWSGLSLQKENLNNLNEGRVFRIELTHGLGEALVGGKTSPDSYLVHVFKGANGEKHVNILNKELGTKKIQVIRLHDALKQLNLTIEEIQILSKSLFLAIGGKGAPESGAAIRALFNRKQWNFEGTTRAFVDEMARLIKEPVSENTIVQKNGFFIGLEDKKLLVLAHVLRELRHDEHAKTVETFVPESMGTSFAATDEEIKQIALAALETTKFYGDIRDIEGGLVNGKPEFVQSRPYTAAKETDQPKIVNLKKRVVPQEAVDKAELEGNLLASGVKGRNAYTGRIVIIDEDGSLIEMMRAIDPSGQLIKELEGKVIDEKGKLLPLDHQIKTIQDMAEESRKTGENLVLVTRFTTPDYNDAIKVTKGIIAFEGGDTSHAAIVSRELGISSVVGIGAEIDRLKYQDPTRWEENLKVLLNLGSEVTVDANRGKVFKGKLPTEEEAVTIDIDKLPPLHFTKPGLIIASDNAMREVSKLGLYDSHYGVSLARAEFFLMEIGVHPLALEAYENLMRLYEVPNAMLHSDPEIHKLKMQNVEKLKSHPELIETIAERIQGYPSAKDFYVQKLSQGIASIAAANGISQKMLYRFTDFKQNELNKMVGGKEFGLKENATMIGHRGAGYLLDEENRITFGWELEAIKRAIAMGYSNIGVFYPFVRTPDELRRGLKRLNDLGVNSKSVGMMVELPSNVMQAEEFIKELALYGEKHPEIDLFFSFGTNDLTQLTLRVGRDESKVATLFRESEESVIASIRHVAYAIHKAKKKFPNLKLSLGLCGQAIVKLANPDETGYNPQAAKEIISMLDSVGTDSLGYLRAVKLAAEAELEHSELSEYAIAEAVRKNLKIGDFKFLSGPEGVSSGRRLRVIRSEKDLERVGIGETLFFPMGLKLPEDKLRAAIDLAGSVLVSQLLVEAGKDWQEMRSKMRRQPSSSYAHEDFSITQELQKLDEMEGLFKQLDKLVRDVPHKPYGSVAEGLEPRLEDGKVYTVDFENKIILLGEIVPQKREPATPDVLGMPSVKTSPLTSSEKNPETSGAYEIEARQYQEYASQISQEQKIVEERPKTVLVVKASELYKKIGIHPLALLDYDSHNKGRLKDHPEIFEKITHVLEQAGIAESKKNKGKKYFRSELFKMMAETLQKIKSSDQAVIYQTSDFTSADFKGLIGGALYEEEEANPPLGFGGLFRMISEEYQPILRWEAEVLEELYRSPSGIPEGMKPHLGIQFTDARLIQHLEKAVSLMQDWALQQHIQIGIRMDNPDNYIRAKDYMRHAQFFSVDVPILFQQYFAADITNKAIPVVKNMSKVQRALTPVIARISRFAAEAGVKEVEMAGKAGDRAPPLTVEITRNLMNILPIIIFPFAFVYAFLGKTKPADANPIESNIVQVVQQAQQSGQPILDQFFSSLSASFLNGGFYYLIAGAIFVFIILLLHPKTRRVLKLNLLSLLRFSRSLKNLIQKVFLNSALLLTGALSPAGFGGFPARNLAPKLGATHPELEELYMSQVEASSPEHIKRNRIFDITDKGQITVILKQEHLEPYSESNPEGLGLWKWLEDYEKEAKVATAGIRFSQNILYPWDTRFRVNLVGVALATLAKALVAKERYPDHQIEKTAGGEVRYNTPLYIDLIARIQAAQGIRTYLPTERQTIPVWMASFLTFMYDLAGAEYVTSSHAVSSFIATKDFDEEGSQYLPEESLRFVAKIREIFEIANQKGEYRFEIAASNDPLINTQLMEQLKDGTDLYVAYLKNGVATDVNLERIKSVQKKIIVDNVGGGFHRTASQIFEKLGINSSFEWFRVKEDSFFHGIGKELRADGKVYDYSQDTTIIKRDKETGRVLSIPVMERMGYDTLLKEKAVGTVVLMVDPDGDRLVTAQIEPSNKAEFLSKIGIDYLILDEDRILALYTPNQSFFLTMVYQAEALKEAGLWENHPRFLIMTTASSLAWREWAEKNGIHVLNVPVGFKEIAAMQRKIESQIKSNPNESVIVKDVFDREVNLGVQPRMLIAGEESGGAVMGPEELIQSLHGRIAIGMREKSDGEMLIIQASLAADLENKNMFLSDYLSQLFDQYEIKGKFDVREDVVYYNQNETDPELLKKEKEEGEARRTKNYLFYLSMALAYRDGQLGKEEIIAILNDTFGEEGLNFDDLTEIYFVGDGVFFQFPNKVLEIRPSGTDAKSKSYAMGDNKAELTRYAIVLGNYTGELTPLHSQYVPQEYVSNGMEIQWNYYQDYYRQGLPAKDYVPPSELDDLKSVDTAKSEFIGFRDCFGGFSAITFFIGLPLAAYRIFSAGAAAAYDGKYNPSWLDLLAQNWLLALVAGGIVLAVLLARSKNVRRVLSRVFLVFTIFSSGPAMANKESGTDPLIQTILLFGLAASISLLAVFGFPILTPAAFSMPLNAAFSIQETSTVFEVLSWEWITNNFHIAILPFIFTFILISPALFFGIWENSQNGNYSVLMRLRALRNMEKEIKSFQHNYHKKIKRFNISKETIENIIAIPLIFLIIALVVMMIGFYIGIVLSMPDEFVSRNETLPSESIIIKSLIAIFPAMIYILGASMFWMCIILVIASFSIGIRKTMLFFKDRKNIPDLLIGEINKLEPSEMVKRYQDLLSSGLFYQIGMGIGDVLNRSRLDREGNIDVSLHLLESPIYEVRTDALKYLSLSNVSKDQLALKLIEMLGRIQLGGFVSRVLNHLKELQPSVDAGKAIEKISVVLAETSNETNQSSIDFRHNYLIHALFFFSGRGLDHKIRDILLADLESGIQTRRARAARALADYPSHQVIERLIAHFEDTDSESRVFGAVSENAMFAFEEISKKNPDLVRDHFDLIRSHLPALLQNPRVDGAPLIRVLQNIDGRNVLKTLIKLSKEVRNRNLVFIVEGLTQFEDPEVVEPLIDVLDFFWSNYSIEFGKTVAALGNLRDQRATEPLIGFLNQRSKVSFYMVTPVIVALGRIGDPRAIKPLLRVLKFSTESSYALNSLKLIGGEEVLVGLQAALKEVPPTYSYYLSPIDDEGYYREKSGHITEPNPLYHSIADTIIALGGEIEEEPRSREGQWFMKVLGHLKKMILPGASLTLFAVALHESPPSAKGFETLSCLSQIDPLYLTVITISVVTFVLFYIFNKNFRKAVNNKLNQFIRPGAIFGSGYLLRSAIRVPLLGMLAAGGGATGGGSTGMSSADSSVGIKISVLQEKDISKLDSEIQYAWNKHYVVFKIENEFLNYVAYIAFQGLREFENENEQLRNHWGAIGATSLIESQNPEKDGLIQALRASSEATAFSAAAGLNIFGAQGIIGVKPGSLATQNSKDGRKRRKEILEHFSIALGYINGRLGGGFFTYAGEDISNKDLEIIGSISPDSILTSNHVYYSALGLKSAAEALLSQVFSSRSLSWEGKVVRIQGLDQTQSLLIPELLRNGAKVVVSYKNDSELKTFKKRLPHYFKDKSYAEVLYVFKEDDFSFDLLGNIPLEVRQVMKLSAIDLAILSSDLTQELDETAFTNLRLAGVRAIIGPRNDFNDKNKISERLNNFIFEHHKRYTDRIRMLYVPGSLAYAGALVAATKPAKGTRSLVNYVDSVIYLRTVELLKKADFQNRTPLEIIKKEFENFVNPQIKKGSIWGDFLTGSSFFGWIAFVFASSPFLEKVWNITKMALKITAMGTVMGIAPSSGMGSFSDPERALDPVTNTYLHQNRFNSEEEVMARLSVDVVYQALPEGAEREKLRSDFEDFAYDAVLNDNPKLRSYIQSTIPWLAQNYGVKPSSLKERYEKMAKGEAAVRTVPSIGLGVSGILATRAGFRASQEGNVEAMVFQLSDFGGVTGIEVNPQAFASEVFSAAVLEKHDAPIFLKLNLKINAQEYQRDQEREIKRVKLLIEKALSAGFKELQIDALGSSMLWDSEKIAMYAHLIEFARKRAVEIQESGDIVIDLHVPSSDLSEINISDEDIAREFNRVSIFLAKLKEALDAKGIALPELLNFDIALDLNLTSTRAKDLFRFELIDTIYRFIQTGWNPQTLISVRFNESLENHAFMQTLEENLDSFSSHNIAQVDLEALVQLETLKFSDRKVEDVGSWGLSEVIHRRAQALFTILRAAFRDLGFARDGRRDAWVALSGDLEIAKLFRNLTLPKANALGDFLESKFLKYFTLLAVKLSVIGVALLLLGFDPSAALASPALAVESAVKLGEFATILHDWSGPFFMVTSAIIFIVLVVVFRPRREPSQRAGSPFYAGIVGLFSLSLYILGYYSVPALENSFLNPSQESSQERQITRDETREEKIFELAEKYDLFTENSYAYTYTGGDITYWVEQELSIEKVEIEFKTRHAIREIAKRTGYKLVDGSGELSVGVLSYWSEQLRNGTMTEQRIESEFRRKARLQKSSSEIGLALISAVLLFGFYPSSALADSGKLNFTWIDLAAQYGPFVLIVGGAALILALILNQNFRKAFNNHFVSQLSIITAKLQNLIAPHTAFGQALRAPLLGALAIGGGALGMTVKGSDSSAGSGAEKVDGSVPSASGASGKVANLINEDEVKIKTILKNLKAKEFSDGSLVWIKSWREWFPNSTKTGEGELVETYVRATYNNIDKSWAIAADKVRGYSKDFGVTYDTPIRLDGGTGLFISYNNGELEIHNHKGTYRALVKRNSLLKINFTEGKIFKFSIVFEKDVLGALKMEGLDQFMYGIDSEGRGLPFVIEINGIEVRERVNGAIARLAVLAVSLVASCLDGLGNLFTILGHAIRVLLLGMLAAGGGAGGGIPIGVGESLVRDLSKPELPLFKSVKIQSLAALGVENQEIYIDLLTAYIGGLSTSLIATKSGVKEDILKAFLARTSAPIESDRRAIEIFTTAALRDLNQQTVNPDDKALMKEIKRLYSTFGYDRARSSAAAIELNISQEDLSKILKETYQGQRLVLAKALASLRSRMAMPIQIPSRYIGSDQLTLSVLHQVGNIRREYIHKLVNARKRHALLRKQIEDPEAKFSFLPPYKEFFNKDEDLRVKVREMREGDWKGTPVSLQIQNQIGMGRGTITDVTQVKNDLDTGLNSWVFNVESIADLSEIGKAIEFLVQELESGRKQTAQMTSIVIQPRTLMAAVEVDGYQMPAGLLDAVAYLSNNLKSLEKLGMTPSLSLEVDTVEEALFWDNALSHLEKSLGLDKATVKVFIHVNSLATVFELEEILWALQKRAQAITISEQIFNSITVSRIGLIAEKRGVHFITDLSLNKTAESNIKVDYSKDAESKLNEMTKGTSLDNDALSKGISEALETLYVHLGGETRGNSFTIQEIDQLEIWQLQWWNAVQQGEQYQILYYQNLFSDGLIKKYKEMEARLELTSGKNFPEIRKKHLTLSVAILQQAVVSSKVFVPLSQLVEVVSSDFTNSNQALERMVQFAEFSSQPNIRRVTAAAKIQLWNRFFQDVFSNNDNSQENRPEVKVGIESSQPITNPSEPIILRIGGIPLAWHLSPIDLKLEIGMSLRDFAFWAATHPVPAILGGVLLMGALALAVKAWIKKISSEEKLIQELAQLAALNNVALAKSKLEKRLAKANKRNERALFLGALHAMGGNVSKGFEKDYKSSIVEIVNENAPVRPVLQAYAEEHIGFRRIIINKNISEKVINIEDARKDKEYEEKFRMGYSAVQMARTGMEQRLEKETFGVAGLNANGTKVIVAGKDGRYSLAMMSHQLDQIKNNSERKIVLTGNKKNIERLVKALDEDKKKILNSKQVKIIPEASGRGGRVHAGRLYKKLTKIGWAQNVELLSENPKMEIEESLYHSMWITIYKIMEDMEVKRVRGMKEAMEDNKVRRLIEIQA